MSLKVIQYILTLEQYRFEMLRSTFMQFFFNISPISQLQIQPWIQNSIFICGWESMDAEGQQYAFFYAIFKIQIIFYYLCNYICPNPPLPPLRPDPSTPSGNPHTIFQVHAWVMHMILWLRYSLCCCLHLHDYSITTNLYSLIPSPFLPIPPTSFSSGNHQNILCIYDYVLFCLFVYFVFLSSIIDRYVFNCHFIVHIFDLLKEDPLTFHVIPVWW